MREDEDEDFAEEFGIDWSERDGFSVIDKTIRSVFGRGAEYEVSPRGLMPDKSPHSLNVIGKYILAGYKNTRIMTEMGGGSYERINKLRRVLREHVGLDIQYCRINIKRNFVGKRYGRLLVLAKGERAKSGGVRFLCKCDCGNERLVSSDALRNGVTKSCGCKGGKPNFIPAMIDMTGLRFGKWTVIQYHEKRHNKTYWKCVCECGEYLSVKGDRLRAGKSKSCGCWRPKTRDEAIERNRQRNRLRGQAQRACLDDSYVAAVIAKTSGVLSKHVTGDMIAAKREHIKVHRVIKELTK